ncbi:5609_t:CDS:2 [Cetraspora pellucida]|uniref:5609_t:CDS:1 n=1 Tax=Cetraspora pellucida TaxID=1433469 RepID=A0A9N9HL00_9GLOM|nr:5609_t:CDS:2 [Cetraspora pellucida]
MDDSVTIYYYEELDVSSQCVSTTCKCPQPPNGLPQGQYCGGYVGMIGCDHTHVYECNPQGGTCDYGIRDSCVQCGELNCTSPTKPPTTTPTIPPNPPGTTCNPACVKPKSCVNSICQCLSSNCPKGQACDAKGICSVSQLPVITQPKPKCSDQKTQNIVEQICESISMWAKPVSFISNSPLDALEVFAACEAAVAAPELASVLTGIGALAVFGGAQTLCVSMAEAIILSDVEGALCSNTWQKFCQI